MKIMVLNSAFYFKIFFRVPVVCISNGDDKLFLWLAEKRPISSWNHFQRSSPSRISDTPWAGFEPEQTLRSGFAEWSYAVVINTTPRRHIVIRYLPCLGYCKNIPFQVMMFHLIFPIYPCILTGNHLSATVK